VQLFVCVGEVGFWRVAVETKMWNICNTWGNCYYPSNRCYQVCLVSLFLGRGGGGGGSDPQKMMMIWDHVWK